MKTFLLLLFTLPLLACPIPDIMEVDAPCEIGHMELLTKNSLFKKTTDSDTIWFKYVTLEGVPVQGYWNEGVTNWACVGFSRHNFNYDLTVWTRTDTCRFTIPAKSDQ